VVVPERRQGLKAKVGSNLGIIPLRKLFAEGQKLPVLTTFTAVKTSHSRSSMPTVSFLFTVHYSS